MSSADAVTDQPNVAPTKRTVADEIRDVAATLSRLRNQRDSSAEGICELQKRNAHFFAERYGVLGEDSSTLEAIGSARGLTRERVRQIIDKMTARSSGLEIQTPVLDNIRNKIADYLPEKVEVLDRLFRDSLGEQLSVAGAQRFSVEILGKLLVNTKDHKVGRQDFGEIAVLTLPSVESSIKASLSAARRMIGYCGAAQIEYVTGAASARKGISIGYIEALRACRLQAGFQWLSEEDGWFWFGPDYPKDNRLLNVAWKVLAASNGRVHIEDIHQAFARNRRTTWSTHLRPVMVDPPIHILRELLAMVPEFITAQRNFFRLRKPIHLDGLLSESEQLIYSVIKEQGGVTSRHRLFQKLVKSGIINPITLVVTLDASPVFTRISLGIYGIRGWRYSSAAIANAIEAVRGAKSRRVTTITHANSDGVVSFDFTITAGCLRNHLITPPMAIADLLPAGEYVVDSAGTNVEYLVDIERRKFRLKKLLPLLIKQGFVEGDMIHVVINSDSRTITLCLFGAAEQAAIP